MEDDQCECHGDHGGDHDGDHGDDHDGDHGDDHGGDHGDDLLRDGGSPSIKRRLIITLKRHVWSNSSL